MTPSFKLTSTLAVVIVPHEEIRRKHDRRQVDDEQILFQVQRPLLPLRQTVIASRTLVNVERQRHVSLTDSDERAETVFMDF